VSGVVVVDASLAVAWVLPEPATEQARARLIEWERREVQRLVPCWFACEVASALYKRRRGGEITLADAERALGDVLAAVTAQTDLGRTAARALALAERLNQRHAYDSHYAALAEREGCELWTADERFFNAAHRLCPWVRWVGSDPDAAAG
jgi:predicted nucleic acid-binding protein